MSCPTLFGLEGIVADELRFGGKLTEVHAENGRVLFEGDESTLAWANLNLRCAERVLIRLGTFCAKSFDDLFEGVRALPWEQFIPQDGAFPVKGHCLDSALHSVPDCQRIIKKAVVSRLEQAYHQSWFEETGAKYQIQFSIMHDTAELYLDTSGAGLHKRGYRANSNAAPLRETLAAAMVSWRAAGQRADDRSLLRFGYHCDRGGHDRAAACARPAAQLRCGEMDVLDSAVWQQAREDALGLVDAQAQFDITGSDIDPAACSCPWKIARKAGVANTIRFMQADAVSRSYEEPGVLFANPPYGERLLDLQAAEKLYEALGKTLAGSPMKQYILCSTRCLNAVSDERRQTPQTVQRHDQMRATHVFKHSPRRSANSR